MFAEAEDRYFFATTMTQRGEAQQVPMPSRCPSGGRRGIAMMAPAYFLATTMVLIVAWTPSTTSTTTM
jgi:hypothetical protein